MNIDLKDLVININKEDDTLEVTASYPLFDDEKYPHRRNISPAEISDFLRLNGYRIGSCRSNNVSLNNRVLGGNEKTWIFPYRPDTKTSKLPKKTVSRKTKTKKN